MKMSILREMKTYFHKKKRKFESFGDMTFFTMSQTLKIPSQKTKSHKFPKAKTSN